MPKSRIVDRMVFSAAGLTAGLDSALKVNQHGVREAKFPDTAGDLGHLGLRMRPRVARAGARRRCWSGSVNLPATKNVFRICGDAILKGALRARIIARGREHHAVI